MSAPSTPLSTTWKIELHKTVVIIFIREWEFKGGIFEDTITPKTSIKGALNILMASDAVTGNEKKDLNRFYKWYLGVLKKYGPREDLKMCDHFEHEKIMEAMRDMFAKDALKRFEEYEDPEDDLGSEDDTVRAEELGEDRSEIRKN